MQTATQVYSYHTFQLPFVWKNRTTHQTSFEAICKVFDQNPAWASTDLTLSTTLDNSVRIRNVDDARLFYQEYQYYVPQVRNALYGFDSSIVNTYTLLPDQIRNKAEYRIQKGDRTYRLMINAINLRVYSNGIGLLILECENHGVDLQGNSQANLAAVKKINEYGRRINLPYWPGRDRNFSSPLCADCLSIYFEGKDRFETDFRKYTQDIYDDRQSLISKKSLTYVANFIKELLGFGSEYHFTSNEMAAKEPKNIYIRPALDDRMYVVCYVLDPEETNRFVKQDEKGKYAFETNANASQSLYELMFVDGDGCTCQDDEMRDRLISEHLYRRWLGYGTMYSVTAMGIIMLTNFGADYLRNPFLTQYASLASLALVQNASLHLYQDQIGELSMKRDSRNKRHRGRRNREILELNTDYQTFVSQLGFSQVTVQEQGIEVWKMMRDSLGISDLFSDVGERMGTITAAAQADSSYNVSLIGNCMVWISVIQIVIKFTSVFLDYSTGKDPEFPLHPYSNVLIYCLINYLPYVLAGVWLIYANLRRKK